MMGDINVDGSVNILDVVIIVNFILNFQTPTDVEFSASVTLRYSDAPKNETGIVLVHKNEDGREISIKPAEETSYIKLRI